MASPSSDPAEISVASTRRGALACLVLWFMAALGVSLSGLLRAGPSDLPIPIGVALLAPLVLGVLAYLRSSRFRRMLFAVELRWLIGVQLWRILGAEFLLAYAHGQLPASFAIPAGVGDLLVGLAAPFVAMIAASGRPAARRIVIGWCIAGIADLVLAVTMGVLNAPGRFGLLAGAVTTARLLQLPLSLIPTFLVPLAVLLHLIVIRRANEIGRAPTLPTRFGLGGTTPALDARSGRQCS